jgi:hypothetical protein
MFNLNPNITKVERYNWNSISGEKGEFKQIHKKQLSIDVVYQRQVSRDSVRKIARNWKWGECGALIVSLRSGKYFIIDGQHRWLAAKSRCEIDFLPCMVYNCKNTSEESKLFFNLNIMRKSLRSVEKHKALMVAGDEDSITLQNICDEFGIKIKDRANSPKTMQSVRTALKILQRNPVKFKKLMKLLSELCIDNPVYEKLLSGLDYIGQFFDLEDKKLRERILKIGSANLIKAADKYSSINGDKNGYKIWALGMLDAINKNLKTKYEIDFTVKGGETNE